MCVFACVYFVLVLYTQIWNSSSWWSERQAVQRNSIIIKYVYVQSKRMMKKTNAIAQNTHTHISTPNEKREFEWSKKEKKTQQHQKSLLYLSSLNCVRCYFWMQSDELCGSGKCAVQTVFDMFVFMCFLVHFDACIITALKLYERFVCNTVHVCVCLSYINAVWVIKPIKNSI